MADIVTLTMNPALDLTYFLDKLSHDHVNIVAEKLQHPGGKGINVSKVLASMGKTSLCWTLLGGHTGALIRNLLSPHDFTVRWVEITDASRQNIKLRVGGQHFEINEPGPVLTNAEIARFEEQFLPDLNGAKILVLSGSLPRGVPEDYYANLIKIAGERGLQVILDASGEPLRQGLAAGPILIKPNKAELEDLLNTRLTNLEQIVAAARKVVDMGTANVLVSLGSLGAILVNDRGAWQSRPPRVQLSSPIGAGDSMVASCAASLIGPDNDDSSMLRIATAAGAAAVEQPGSLAPSWQRVRQLVTEVVIREWK